jgi:cyclopropane fatty-acyl-phospholipid synthase-like methyltransferase
MVESSGWKLERLVWRLQDTLRDIDWRGKEVLEIGCGRADMSLYMALTGAKYVEAIDPEGPGSRPGTQITVQQRIEALQPSNFRFQPITFGDAQYAPESFDLILSVNVIEHIHETRKLLTDDPEATADYQRFFADLYRVLRPGGALVISNVSRYSLWALISQWTNYRLKTPIWTMRNVHWQLHQPPNIWTQMAQQAGFHGTHVHWRVPHQLHRLRWLMDNRFVQFLTFADFAVTANKPHQPLTA